MENAAQKSTETPEKDPESAQKHRKTPKKPRKITKKYLKNAAMFYLERWAAPAEGVRQVLNRRIEKAKRHYEPEPETLREWNDWREEVITDLQRFGLVDDEGFARARTETLKRRGESPRMIRLKLQQKGVLPETIETVTAHFDDETMDQAAETFARRKRLGPYNKDGAPEAYSDAYNKELAKMARAGFPLNVAKKVLSGDS